MRHLQEIGVEIHLNIRVQSCESGVICMSAGNLEADLIVWTAGSKPSGFYANNPEVFTLGRAGKVVVDENLLAQTQSDIYVIGDNADTPYSGMAQTALYDANFVSRNLLRLEKNQKTTHYRAKRPLYVVTAGPKWAIVQEGSKITSGYRGWIIRRRADLWIFKNFQPYKLAIKTWRQAHRMSKM
jgi:NADH dehydrogenase FAD-containing subunit